MNKKHIVGIVLTTTLSLFLTACGGGGGSDNNETAKPVTPVTPTQPTSTIDDEFGKWLVDLGNNHIIPSYNALAERSAVMKEDSTNFCAKAEQSLQDLAILQQSWRDLNQRWQVIQWVKVGPIIEDNRLFRIHYWPDTKSSVASGINKLLDQNEAITEELVAKQSVGTQGIPALENLLFAKQSNASLLSASDKVKRCDALMAISANVATISHEVQDGWRAADGDFIAQLTEGTGEFTSKKDSVEELVTNWLEQIERVKDEKMLKPLSGTHDEEQSLSGESIASIKTNIATFKTIYTAGDGHGFDNILTDHLDQLGIATEMQLAIESAIESANALADDYEAQLNDDAGRININKTISDLRLVRDILTADFVQVTDINIGFNSNDGD
jgi:hypothetical protein